MADSAVSHTPIEIWWEIFRCALATKNQPQGVADGQFEMLRNLQLFWRECHSAKEYIESEVIRRSLRLVCRAWNAQLMITGTGASIGDHLLLTDMGTRYWSGSSHVSLNRLRRVEIHTDLECACDEPCAVGRHWKRSAFYGSFYRDKIREMRTCDSLPQLDVLIIDPEYRLDSSLDLLRKAPMLKVLLIKGNSFLSYMNSRDINSSRRFAQLTNLALAAIKPPDLFELVMKVSLPDLLALDITFYYRHSGYGQSEPAVSTSTGAQPDGPILSERFPKLRCLALGGTIQTILRLSLESFIRRFASTVTQFSNTDLIWDNQGREYLDVNIRDIFPKLELYAVNFADMLHVPPLGREPSPSHTTLRPLSTLLKGFSMRFQSADSIIRHGMSFLQGCKRIHCTRAFFEQTWDECYDEWCGGSFLLETIATKTYKARVSLMIAGIVKRGVGIYDRNSVPYDVDVDDCIRFIEESEKINAKG